MRGKRWGERLVVAAAVVCMMACGGCESEDTESDITTTRFNVDRDLLNYTETDEFTWETTLNQALTTVRIKDFKEGDTTLRIYDGRGDQVQSAFFNTVNNVYYDGRDLFFQQRTDVGVAGTWRIVLAYADFTGEISITME